MEKDEQELVEMIISQWADDGCPTAEGAIKAIKKDIGKIADVCFECYGNGMRTYSSDDIIPEECRRCHGTGVVAKGESQ